MRSNCFAHTSERKIKHWNKEHGFGDDNDDRAVGNGALFDLNRSRP